MKTYKNLYSEICCFDNLLFAWKKARKRKTRKDYVKEFEEDLLKNLLELSNELENQTYKPRSLKTFIIRDPKTRRISKSHFRDRIVHHALYNIIEPIFDKTFIYDSYANRRGKGNLAALKRLDYFKRKVTRNGKINGWFNNNQIKGYCLKADIKHYFQTVNHEILLNILKKKIKDEKVILLIKKILNNYEQKEVGMPLGNLTSQFFANVYLNELDYFIKHELKIEYYIRYVDDFVILNKSKKQLNDRKLKINEFLKIKLKVELHPDKSKIVSLGRGITFVGFRVFYHYKLLKKFNRKNIQKRLNSFYKLFLENKINYDKIYESMQGSFAYMNNANTFNLRKELAKQIEKAFPTKISSIEINRYLKLKKTTISSP